MTSRSAPIRFNKAHFPVTVLGPGRRLGVWLQGCSIRCPGCISKDTWSDDPDRETDVAGLVAACRELCSEPPDGVTISGGEPFDQPEALAALVDGLRNWHTELPDACDILVYSGYELETIERDHGDILSLIDVLIPGPYRDGKDGTARWRGSRNQPVVKVSALGRERWDEYDLAAPNEKSLQVIVDESSIWAIGVPGVGDMEALARLAAERGLVFDGVSW